MRNVKLPAERVVRKEFVRRTSAENQIDETISNAVVSTITELGRKKNNTQMISKQSNEEEKSSTIF